MVRVLGIEFLWVGGLGFRLVGLYLTDLTCELNHTSSRLRGDDF